MQSNRSLESEKRRMRKGELKRLSVKKTLKYFNFDNHENNILQKGFNLFFGTGNRKAVTAYYEKYFKNDNSIKESMEADEAIELAEEIIAFQASQKKSEIEDNNFEKEKLIREEKEEENLFKILFLDTRDYDSKFVGQDKKYHFRMLETICIYLGGTKEEIKEQVQTYINDIIKQSPLANHDMNQYKVNCLIEFSDQLLKEHEMLHKYVKRKVENNLA